MTTTVSTVAVNLTSTPTVVPQVVTVGNTTYASRGETMVAIPF